MKTKPLKRGDIFYANLNPVLGSEQGDNRPVLIVQNNVGNAHSPTVVVAPLTKKLQKGRLPTHVLISQVCGLDSDSLALTEQIRTIDRSRLGNYVGHISATEQSQIDKALSVCVGLKSKQQILTLTLCSRCASDFEESGKFLSKQSKQKHQEPCDFCHTGRGWTYEVGALR